MRRMASGKGGEYEALSVRCSQLVRCGWARVTQRWLLLMKLNAELEPLLPYAHTGWTEQVWDTDTPPTSHFHTGVGHGHAPLSPSHTGVEHSATPPSPFARSHTRSARGCARFATSC